MNGGCIRGGCSTRPMQMQLRGRRSHGNVLQKRFVGILQWMYQITVVMILCFGAEALLDVCYLSPLHCARRTDREGEQPIQYTLPTSLPTRQDAPYAFRNRKLNHETPKTIHPPSNFLINLVISLHRHHHSPTPVPRITSHHVRPTSRRGQQHQSRLPFPPDEPDGTCCKLGRMHRDRFVLYHRSYASPHDIRGPAGFRWVHV